MKIGNVIHEGELVNHTRVDYINYINEAKAYDEIDKSLPTLYVGWNFMKSCNIDNEFFQTVDILKKKIVTDELYWEFSFSESKASHIKGVDKFVSLVPEFYFAPKYTYINLDPVFFQLKDSDDFMDVVAKKIDRYYNYKDEMVYLLVDNKITGIDLKMYEFFRFDIDRMKSDLKQRTVSVITDDIDTEIYKTHYKIFPNFDRLKRYVVVMLSK